MPDDLTQLATIKSQALARIIEITSSPKPTYSIDGQSVSWSDYLRQLQETVAWCDERLAGDDPFEFATEAYT